MSFVTPDFKQEQAAARAQKPGGRGREEGAGRPRPALGPARASPAPHGGRGARSSSAKTQRTRQLPGEKRLLEEEPAHARVTQSGGAYVHAVLAHRPALHGSGGSVRELAAP